MNVILTLETLDYLENLVEILYQKEYFGFMETSKQYVAELLDDIKAKLPILPRKVAPKYFEKYEKGLYYATFQKNKRTTWYVFFRMYRLENNQIIYQVRYIDNNHAVAQYL
ncbi:MAG: hypothetical protein LBU91_05105 [Bacteroidales bacterium]|jgi:hypothetical protein|nr:hypothetical protein [Bacteroidales bacterium]